MNRGGRLFLSIVAAVAILVPLLNLAVPPASPLHVSAYTVTLVGKYLCYATLALAVDLVWGLGTLHCLTQQQPAVAPV